MVAPTPFKLATPGIRIAPSLLAADFSRLGEQVDLVERSRADLLHLDVMDGHFVPNLSFGPGVIKDLRSHSKLFFDAHLMIADPRRYAESFVEAGCDHITFHIEATDAASDVVAHIRGLGVSVGVCLNPTTPAADLDPVLEAVDLVLVMSVWPGFGGQAFIPDVLSKVEALRKRLRPDQRLEIDGGIDRDTIGRAVAAGADTLVAGSAIFGATDPVTALRALRERAIEKRRIANGEF